MLHVAGPTCEPCQTLARVFAAATLESVGRHGSFTPWTVKPTTKSARSALNCPQTGFLTTLSLTGRIPPSSTPPHPAPTSFPWEPLATPGPTLSTTRCPPPQLQGTRQIYLNSQPYTSNPTPQSRLFQPGRSTAFLGAHWHITQVTLVAPGEREKEREGDLRTKPWRPPQSQRSIIFCTTQFHYLKNRENCIHDFTGGPLLE